MSNNYQKLLDFLIVFNLKKKKWKLQFFFFFNTFCFINLSTMKQTECINLLCLYFWQSLAYEMTKPRAGYGYPELGKITNYGLGISKAIIWTQFNHVSKTFRLRFFSDELGKNLTVDDSNDSQGKMAAESFKMLFIIFIKITIKIYFVFE